MGHLGQPLAASSQGHPRQVVQALLSRPLIRSSPPDDEARFSLDPSRC